MSPWEVLGVGHDVAVGDLRRHYAALIKQFRPETHPQDFARIREAYEFALPHARRREAEEEAAMAVEVEAEQGAAVEAVGPVDGAGAAAAMAIQDAEVEPAQPAATVVATALQSDARPDGAPSLAERFHAFHALAQSATDTDDASLLPALRDLLRARALASLDDSQALEFALMRWFIESDPPPLTLLFETGRAFDWHAHVARLSNWLTPWALRQMEARLALSRDLVYARHFTHNAWLRRLHSPRPRLPWLVIRPSALEARHWATRWQVATQDAEAPVLEGRLDAACLARLRGGLASTDLLVGLIVAAIASELPQAAVLAAGTTAIMFLARRGLQAIVRLPSQHWLRGAARTLISSKWQACVGSAFLGVIGLALLSAPQPIGRIDGFAVVGYVAGGALVALAVLLVLAPLWLLAGWLELAAAAPWHWREAVDRLEFDRFVASRAMPPAAQPFGPRLGQVQRWKVIRAALSLQAREVAQGARPPRRLPFTFKLIRLASSGSSNNKVRLLWYSLWALFVVLRLLHSYGH